MHLHIVRFNLTVTQGPQLQVWVVPLSPRDLSTPGLTAAEICWHSEFVRVWQAVTPPSPIGSFTSNIHTTTLHLNAFRGVRAISEFDQPFTPTHKSSGNFSTFISSVLHPGTTGTSTCSWVDHSVSRLYPLPIALFRLAFATPPVLKTLNLVVSNNSQAHYAKGTWSLALPPLVGVRFQGLLHSASCGSFHLSFTVLVHYRSLESIQPYRMVPADSDRVSPAPPYSGF